VKEQGLSNLAIIQYLNFLIVRDCDFEYIVF